MGGSADVVTEMIEVAPDHFKVPKEKWLCCMEDGDDVTVWVGSEDQISGRSRNERKALAAKLAEQRRGHPNGCRSAYRPDHGEDREERVTEPSTHEA